MKKILILTLLTILGFATFAQDITFPQPRTLGGDKTNTTIPGLLTLTNPLVLPGTDTIHGLAYLEGALTMRIANGDTSIYQAMGTYWKSIYRTIYAGDGLFFEEDTIKLENNLTFATGLISASSTLADTSLTVFDVKWRRDNVLYEVQSQAFPISRATPANYRIDLIYIDTFNTIQMIIGVESTEIGVPPDLPEGGITVTTVTVFGTVINVTPPSSPISWLTTLNTIGIGNFRIGTIDKKPIDLYVNNSPRTKWDTTGTMIVQGTPLTDTSRFSAELTTTGTGTNWTGTSLVTGYTHTTGSTTALTTTLAPVIGQYYLIYFVSAHTTGSLGITFGGFSSNSQFSTTYTGFLATTTGVLTLTPTTDYNGTVTVSIKRVIGILNPNISIKSANGSVVSEMRFSRDTTNVFIGKNSGSYVFNSNVITPIGGSNVGLGTNTLQRLMTGNDNIAIGRYSLSKIIANSQLVAIGGYSQQNAGASALYNTSVGYQTLASMTAGLFNTAIGYNSSKNITNSNYNTGVGYESLGAINTGGSNTAIGAIALNSISTGSDNTVIGSIAMANLSGLSSRNIGIGSGAMIYASGVNSDNITIGTNALRGNSGQTGTSMNKNVLLGNNTLYKGYLAFNNTLIGHEAGNGMSNGYGNVALGNAALYKSGHSNIILGAITGGSGYVNGTYTSVPLQLLPWGSQGTPVATITVSGGAVTSVVITDKSWGYAYGNTSVTANNFYLGGTGSGFSVAITTVTAGGNYNIAIGDSAMVSLRDGTGNIVIGHHVDIQGDTANSNKLNIGGVILGDGVYSGTTMSSTPVTSPSIAIGGLPNSKAILDLTSTTKGFLTPRMTQSQRDAITSPTTGLLIYQTDNTPGFYYYNGSAWTAIGGGSSSTPNIEQFTGSTSTTITLAQTPVSGSFWISKNGIDLPDAEFTQTGTNVTLNSARVSGDVYRAHYNY